MKVLHAFFLAFAVAFIGSIITVFIMGHSVILDAKNYPMDVTVTDDRIIGINVDPEGFHFGSLNQGGGAMREFHINHIERDFRVRFRKQGSMSAWVSTPEPFLMVKGESKVIPISISIPYGTPLGNYTGLVTVVLEKP